MRRTRRRPVRLRTRRRIVRFRQPAPACQRWTVELESLPDAVPAEVRIKRALKMLGRQYRLRVVGVGPAEAR